MVEYLKGVGTRSVHSGEPKSKSHGAVIEPVYMSSTFEYQEGEGYHDGRYMRMSNTPNHDTLHAKIAALEGGEAALVTSSGMSAITTTLFTMLKSGDHLLSQHQLYGGTYDFFTRTLANFGIGYDFIDLHDPDSWKSKLRPNTKAIYVESLSNPMLHVGGLPEIVSFARDNGLVSLIDNTVTSPINFRPIEHGFDLVLHSATKYLNGHSDIVAGAVVGKTDAVRSVKLRLDHLGGSLDSHACFLLNRGIKTMPLRVAKNNLNGMLIASFLEDHPAVSKVNYPGLPSHIDYARAKELFDGCSSLLSFKLGSGDQARKFIQALTLFSQAPSLGGVESLVTRPIKASHGNFSAEECARQGVVPELVRLSLGVEDADDLIADIGNALDAS